MDLILRLLRLPLRLPRPLTNDVSVRRPRLPRPARGTTGYQLLRAVLLVSLVVAVVGAAVWFLPQAWLHVVVPLVAVTALRAVDVTLGVFRTTFIMRGRMLAAAAAAAAEAGVWLSAAGIVLADLTLARGIAFAVGVGAGTATGMGIVRWLRLGMVTVRVFAPAARGDEVAATIRQLGHGVTVFPGRGRDGAVDMLLSVVRRREASAVCAQLAADPSLYVTLDSDPVSARG